MTYRVTDSGAPAADSAAAASATQLARRTRCIVTRMHIAAPAEQVWKSLIFYEQIEEPPPLYLRLMLPRPIRTLGPKSSVGDEATCLYQGGHLLKRVTGIDPRHRYEFTVAEQNLVVGRGVRLSGGCYALREAAHGGTELSITTRYLSSNRPRWLAAPLEAAVCHLFHRFLLGAIRRKAESHMARIY